MTATGVDRASLEIRPSTLGAAEHRNFRMYACAVFVLLGMITTMLGPLLPLLSSRWQLSLAQAGSLFSWQFGGATLGTLLTAIAARNVRNQGAVIAGLSLCGLGVLGLSLLSWPGLPWAIACYGLGLGVLIPIINLAVAASESGSSAASLSILNLCWTIGAVVAPLLLEAVGSPDTFLYGIVAIAVGALMTSFFVAYPNTYRVPESISSAPAHALRAVAIFGGLFFLYVGTENAISGWLTFYAIPALHSSYRAMTVTSVFWVAFMAGRAVAPAVLKRISQAATVRCGIAAALLGVTCLSFASGPNGMFISAGLTAIGLAPLYPVFITRLVRRVGASHPIAVVCFACSGIGAAVLPLASGWVSESTGRVSSGLVVPTGALILSLVASVAFLRPDKHPATQ